MSKQPKPPPPEPTPAPASRCAICGQAVCRCPGPTRSARLVAVLLAALVAAAVSPGLPDDVNPTCDRAGAR